MADAAYEAAVKTTFETKPLRTVLLIDDEFPTFSDLACGETEENKTKFAQKDRAVRLYEGLRKHHMNCDFENTATGLEIDRFRKSDLIILDYHLGPTPNDTETSIKLLRELSLSKHFNTVIVYTEEPNLDKVWLDIVAAVSGGWKAFTDDLEGVASEKWEELSDRDALPTAPLEASMQFARRREIRDLDSEVRGPVQSELEALEVPATTCGDIITAMIHRDMVARAGMYAAEPHQPTLGDYREGVRWIQTQNSFVCILQKDDSEPVGEETEKLMVYLRRALLAWRPNLFQILVSEIQNILELEALTTVNHLLGEATTHTALWCYLLETIGPVDPTSNPNVRAPLLNVVDKVVDGIRRRLSEDEELLDLASDALLGQLRDVGLTERTWPRQGQNKLVTKAKKLAGTEGLVKKPDVYFRLNSFFGTEEFRPAHLTTGTICFHPEEDEYFVIASPACDLMARQPRPAQRWANAIHPLTPVMAIRLETDVGRDAALGKATHGQHIFLEVGKEQKVFKIVNENGQPSYEFFFATEEGRTCEAEGKVVVKIARFTPGGGSARSETASSGTIDNSGSWVTTTFVVIGQLRDMNATRVLQMAGQHLSRIGLDFVNMPS